MPDLLSLRQMARRAGVTQQWLREESDAGRVPCLPAGTRYLYEPEAVIRALADRAAEGEQPVSITAESRQEVHGA